MIRQFNERGVRFRYPETWELERQENDNGWLVSLQSPKTAFLMITVDEEMPSIEQMAQTALEALRSEYPDLDADECVDAVAGQPAVGHDIQFFSLDLTNTCWTRSFYSENGTVLVLWQASDLELETLEPILRAICASLEVGEV